MARSRREPAEGMRSLRRTRAIRPTWRAWTSLGIGAVSLALAYALGRAEYLVVAALAVLLPVLGLLFVRVRRPRFRISRTFAPPVVSVGGTAQVTVTIENAGAAPSVPLAWDDALPWAEPLHTHELDEVAPGRLRARTARYDVHPVRRGVFPIGPFVARHADPFGMATSTIAIGAPDRLVVVPAVSSLAEGGPMLADGDGEAQLVQRRVSGDADDLTTREYRAGDALRRVHWRASARHGELMVRQEEHRSHPDARLVVDTRRRGYPDAERDPGVSWAADWLSESFEWVLRMAASLGLHLEAAGFRVAIEETARGQIDALGDRWDGRRPDAFLTSLASVDLVDGVAGELAVAPASDGTGPVFAVLGDPEEATVDWLIRGRRAGEPGYAFLASPRPGVADRLSDAGWTVVVAHEDVDPADAWRAAGRETGALRGAR